MTFFIVVGLLLTASTAYLLRQFLRRDLARHDAAATPPTAPEADAPAPLSRAA